MIRDMPGGYAGGVGAQVGSVGGELLLVRDIACDCEVVVGLGGFVDQPQAEVLDEAVAVDADGNLGALSTTA
ncbi:hypothetical protein CLOM_g11132 [Closterium sp. NIES-68]|nr:hypothetical protein CLOM_g11132 [Closterium sp. NIES-68]